MESLEIYKKYRDVLEKLNSYGEAAPYDWGKGPYKSHISWMPYYEMLKEFRASLANSINQMRRYEKSLGAWDVVLSDFEGDKKLSIYLEFVEATAILTACLPYTIKSRFIFSVAHLCNRANASSGRASDDLPVDSEIVFSVADEVGRFWKKYGKLKVHMERIGDRSYNESVNNFRNIYNHQIEPRFVLGGWGIVKREAKDGKVVYSIGGEDPIELSVLRASIRKQIDRSLRAYRSFQDLVHEHIEAGRASM